MHPVFKKKKKTTLFSISVTFMYLEIKIHLNWLYCKYGNTYTHINLYMVHFFVCMLYILSKCTIRTTCASSLKSKNPDFLYRPSNLHVLQVHINMNMRSTTFSTGLNQVASFLGNNFALGTCRRPAQPTTTQQKHGVVNKLYVSMCRLTSIFALKVPYFFSDLYLTV